MQNFLNQHVEHSSTIASTLSYFVLFDMVNEVVTQISTSDTAEDTADTGVTIYNTLAELLDQNKK